MSLRKPPNYWTKERCTEESLKYQTRTEFQRKSYGSYDSARKFGILEDICEHMGSIVKKRGKRKSFEECKEIVSKYKTNKEFITKEHATYQTIKRNGWGTELLKHLEYQINPSGDCFKPAGYWDYERCKEESLKYNTYYEFRKKNYTAYQVIKDKGWREELCGHMTMKLKPRGYWTYEICKETALRYDDRNLLSNNEGACYTTILKNNWDELLSHITKKTTLSERFIYAFEFPDNHVYVGLTYDLNKRKSNHLRSENSSVFKHIKKTGLEFTFKSVYKRPFPADIAGDIEKEVVEDYKSKGWITLNIAKAGGLGGGYFNNWTKEKCRIECLKYDKVSTLRRSVKLHLIYIIKDNGWWEELTSHMKRDSRDVKRIWSKWDREKILEVAKNVNKPSEFRTKYKGAYKAALGLGIKEEVYGLYEPKEKSIANYTKEDCLNITLKYKYKSEFAKNHKGVYCHCAAYKWLEEVTKHLIDGRIDDTFKIYENCKIESSKYNSRNELRAKCRGCYESIYSNKWYELLPPLSPKGPQKKSK